MTMTRLTNVIVPEVYQSYQAVNSPELTAFAQAGIATNVSALQAFWAVGGKTVHMPFWNDLDSSVEPNYSNDDPADFVTPNNVTTGEMGARKSWLNQAYGAAALVKELAGSDPMQQIRNRFGTYWARQWQRRLLAVAVGVLNENVANGASDMIINVSIADGNNATEANLFSRDAFVNAGFTMGDLFDSMGVIAMHSMVYRRLVKNEDIIMIPDSNGTLNIPTYMGKRVVVDDGMPVAAGGTSGFIYTSILFAPGAFGFAEQTADVPVEIDRQPLAGHGGATEVIIERKNWIIHPLGYKWNETTVTGPGLSPTLANLRLAANWTRVVTRKLVPMAFLLTNG